MTLSLEELEQRLAGLESQERLDRGLVASVNRGLTAVTNGQAELLEQVKQSRAEFARERDIRKKERAADRKELHRLAAIPLSGLGFIISGQVDGTAQPSQLITTLIVLVLAGLFPELRDSLLRRRSSADEGPASEAKPQRGNGLASDPPARSGH